MVMDVSCQYVVVVVFRPVDVFVGWINGCISTQTRSVYKLHKFRIRSCFISGAVCVLGGRLVMSRMIFFCILMSG